MLNSLTAWRLPAVAAVATLGALAAYLVVVHGNAPTVPPGISPEVQASLHMTEPTHTSPTPWGEFLIVPVAAPSTERGDEPSPVPEFGAAALVSGELAGTDAPDRASAMVPRFVGLSVEGKKIVAGKGLVAVGAQAKANVNGSFLSAALYGKEPPNPGMLQITAYTPTIPVRVTEFPDTAIYDFRASTLVNGNPTITKFPDKGTSDPNGDREIKWSQRGVVYFLKSFGPFTDEDLLTIAVGISVQEEARK